MKVVFNVPWAALSAARHALANRAQEIRCAAIHCARPEDKALSVLSAEAMEKSVARLKQFERELPNNLEVNPSTRPFDPWNGRKPKARRLKARP